MLAKGFLFVLYLIMHLPKVFGCAHIIIQNSFVKVVFISIINFVELICLRQSKSNRKIRSHFILSGFKYYVLPLKLII